MRVCERLFASFLSTTIIASAAPAIAQSNAPAPAASRLPTITVSAPKQAAKKRTQRAPAVVSAPSSRQGGADLQGVQDGQGGGPGRGAISTSVTALPAATTVVNAPTISRAPIATYGDLFRFLPGFNVSNFGQGAIGYGISMRGYTEAEHGRDIAYSIDGMPVNEVSSLHTPNYADLNILLPESIKSIEVIRGPFSVEYGDSNLGGSVAITTKQAEPFASVGVSGGTQGTVRGLATYSTTQGAYLPYIALEGYRTDGYRDNSFVDRYNSFNKITTTLPDGGLVSFRAQAYGTTFGAPGYASRDATWSGAISERSATNPTDGGNKQLENFVANYASGAAGQELKATLFVSHDTFNRYADFGGGQRWQHDDRTMSGGRISKVWTGALAQDIPVQVLVGGNWRTDIINAFQAPTTARAVSGAPVIDLGLAQYNLAAFGQVQIKPLEWLKLTAGARYDQFFYNLNDHLNPGGTPNTSYGVTTPKFGLAITPVKWLELFANYGQGFRSIDVPLELIGNPGIQPFKVSSVEGGVQFTSDRFRVLVDYWTTRSENESFQPAPGLPVTFLGKAERDGFDLDARFMVVKEANTGVAVFANYSGVRARLLDAAPSFYVPNVPAYVANLGVEFSTTTANARTFSGLAYVTFVGQKYISQDGLLTTSPFSRITGKLAYSWPEGWTAFAQATWYPGDRLSEIAVNFGPPTGATSADVFVSAQPALVVLAGLTYRFRTAVASISPALVTK